MFEARKGKETPASFGRKNAKRLNWSARPSAFVQRECKSEFALRQNVDMAAYKARFPVRITYEKGRIVRCRAYGEWGGDPTFGGSLRRSDCPRPGERGSCPCSSCEKPSRGSPPAKGDFARFAGKNRSGRGTWARPECLCHTRHVRQCLSHHAGQARVATGPPVVPYVAFVLCLWGPGPPSTINSHPETPGRWRPRRGARSARLRSHDRRGRQLCCGRPLYDWGPMLDTAKKGCSCSRQIDVLKRRRAPVIGGSTRSCISVFRDEGCRISSPARRTFAKRFVTSAEFSCSTRTSRLPQLKNELSIKKSQACQGQMPSQADY